MLFFLHSLTLFAVCDRLECLVGDVLERFGPADVAGIRVHLKEGLDFGHASDYSANGDEPT